MEARRKLEASSGQTQPMNWTKAITSAAIGAAGVIGFSLTRLGIPPDLEFDGAALDYVHRRTAEADIHFVQKSKSRSGSRASHRTGSGKGAGVVASGYG